MSVLDKKLDRRALLKPALKAVAKRPAPAHPPGAIARLDFDAAACWADQGINPDCDYCYDRCPLKGTAVTLSRGQAPVFDMAVCTGCGICVYYCPAQPKPLSTTSL
jgi:Pyruvate/2-oxoacid:ferredoxin oxidoreductase delta subunit